MGCRGTKAGLGAAERKATSTGTSRPSVTWWLLSLQKEGLGGCCSCVGYFTSFSPAINPFQGRLRAVNLVLFPC